jgi:thiol-disulfide isomerase/thioredoxin
MSIDVRRLLLALVVLGVTVAPLYFFVLQSGADKEEGFANARLVDTPPVRGVAIGAGEQQAKVGTKNGELAPDFEISTPDGSRLRLSELRGRPVLISFFALWCGSCLAEMPEIKAVQEERGLESFTVLAVNTGETRERAMEFIDFIDATFVYGLDFGLTVSDAYGIHGLPYTVYIDASGVVRAAYAGQANSSRLNAYLDAAFKGAEPSDQPFEIRLISSIPREHVLQVESQGPGTLLLTSRRLRCDSTYCADSVAAALKTMSGVSGVQAATAKDGQPALEVRFTPDSIAQAEIVSAVVGMLNAIDDPLFDTPLEVRFTDQ